jgi:hypothetical protein
LRAQAKQSIVAAKWIASSLALLAKMVWTAPDGIIVPDW